MQINMYLVSIRKCMQNIHFIDMPRQRFLTHPLKEKFVITLTWWVLLVVLVNRVCLKKNEWIKLSVVTLALKYGSWWFKRGTMKFSHIPNKGRKYYQWSGINANFLSFFPSFFTFFLLPTFWFQFKLIYIVFTICKNEQH